MSSGPEFTTVESPFIDQFIAMGWKLVAGHLNQPTVGGCETFSELLIRFDLCKTVGRISLYDGKPCLHDSSVAQAIGAPEVAEVPKPHVVHCGVMDKFLKHRAKVDRFLTETAA